jgi:hypothetical protein
MVVLDIKKKTCLMCSVNGAKKRQRRSLRYRWNGNGTQIGNINQLPIISILHAKFCEEKI